MIINMINWFYKNSDDGYDFAKKVTH